MVWLKKLAVTVTYTGEKQDSICHVYSDDDRMDVLRKDLTALQIPHPKLSNVQFLPHGPHGPHTVQFYWITPQDSTLHNQLRMKIKDPAKTPAHIQRLKELSIKRMWLYDSSDTEDVQPELPPPGSNYYRKSYPSSQHVMDVDDYSPSKPTFYASNSTRKRQRDSFGYPGSSSSTSIVKAERISPEPSMLFGNTPSSLHNRLEPASPKISLIDRVDTSPNRQRTTSWGDHNKLPAGRDEGHPITEGFVQDFMNSSIEIPRLKLELQETRRKESEILSRLKELNADDIPESNDFGASSDSSLRERMLALEREVEAEKRLRLTAEAILKDVQNECNAPFVVPALLEAFAEISKLTSLAMS